ncbi:pimeloyl-ACP methyl ester carboxylesterase [Catenulispora sp. MAP12-49]|uniref:alpha/beta fold hydrolase n=1 Tax=Catenulispora sp. MAP12-49 TaxID=3156302 RepID=UPI0035119567
MRRIEVPTLLIASTVGQEVPPEVSLYLRSAVPRARLAEIPGADHFVFAFRPGLVDLLVESFVMTSGLSED